MKLNKSQQNAVFLRDGPALILAGPGSGKTSVITMRVKALIDSGVLPENILVITFTRAAADEMKERFSRLSGKMTLPVTFGTFHSVFFNILKIEVGLNSNSILQDNIRYQILKEILLSDIDRVDDEGTFVNSLLDEISKVKTAGGLFAFTKTGKDGKNIFTFRPKSTTKSEFLKIYKLYHERLRKLKLIDFDDMLLMARRLFMERPDTLYMWRDRYKYILVDEFQDVNEVQYNLIKMLAAPLNNLFVVGDDDQSIYGFRGASPKVMLSFPMDYKSCKRILLDTNYRSDAMIVDASKKLISHNSVRFNKRANAFFEGVNPPQIIEFSDTDAENTYIVETIARLYDSGLRYSDIAVLYRTNRLYRSLAERLSNVGIPFVVDANIPNIYNSFLAEDILSYLRVIYGSNDRADYLRIINKPSRFIKREYFDKDKVILDEIISKCESNDERMYLRKLQKDINIAKKLRPYLAISYIRNNIGYDRYITEYAKKYKKSEKDLLGTMDEIMESSIHYDTFARWNEWIKEYCRTYDERSAKANVDKIEKGGIAVDAVRVMTMHRSKGLEFSAVILPDVCDGICPYHLASSSEEIEEERRLFFVAITRAKKYLYILSTKVRYNRRMDISRFIYELGLDEINLLN